MGQRPMFKGDGLAVWLKLDKNNNPYLDIKVLDNFFLKAWFNKKDEQQTSATQEQILKKVLEEKVEK